MADEDSRRKHARWLRRRIDRLRSPEEEAEKPASPREFTDRKAREEIDRERPPKRAEDP
ncbi:MAG: hypothetical protein WBZ00_02295 [Solirubrobacterales bacterium]